MSDRPADGEPLSRVWLVVNSHANQERVAIGNLVRQHYETYCPMILKRRSHARRVEEVIRPLFPGYLFARLDPLRERWRPIASTIGVRSIVHFGETLGTISDDFIHSLRLRENDGLILSPKTTYQVGQQVRLNAGAFDGVIATVLAVDEKQRLTILMDILQRQVRIKVRHDQVMTD
jgi:transcriptional antiterminator RfaH